MTAPTIGDPEATAPPGGVLSRWRRLGRGQRAVTAVVAVVLAVNVVLAALGSLLGGDPGGPVSSSFSTGGDGLEAYADLLREAGHPVTRLRDAPSSSDLAGAGTVVVADPTELTAADARALARFTADGGTLVLAGSRTSPLLARLTGQPVRWSTISGSAERLAVWVPSPETGGADGLAGDDGSRWADPGGLLPLVGAGGQPAVVTGAVGEGRVVALASASPLHNANLARADNARFGLGLAGPADSRVVFVESVHGFATSGFDAVPASWKWTALGLGLAAVVGLWAAGTRFGPPEPDRRALRPPRLDHVVALAADLDRVSPPPADPAAAMAEGALAAAAERRARGMADPDADTVPARPHRGGTNP